jgi:hypothetical protein
MPNLMIPKIGGVGDTLEFFARHCSQVTPPGTHVRKLFRTLSGIM